MKFLSPEAIKIWRIEDDSLVMKIDGRKRFLGAPRCALPISDAEHWIVLSDSDGEEIGILPSLDGLPAQARELISQELEREYTLERIVRIINVDREPLTGQTHWRVELAPPETASSETAPPADENSAVPGESATIQTPPISRAKSFLSGDLKTLVKSSHGSSGSENGTASEDDGEKTGTLSKVASKILSRDKSDEEPSRFEREFTIAGQEDVAVARYPQIFIVDTERRRYEISNCDALDLDSRRAADRFF